MRCQEVLDQLPVLAYDELDNECAARCHEHLANCAACQAEWKSIQGALSLLDQAPRRQTQVDLAAICLRIARQQRRSRTASRWTIGVSAAAALVVGMISAQLLAVNLEPGRLTVAWSATPAPVAQETGDQTIGDRVGPLHSTHDGGSGARQVTQPAGAPATTRQRSPSMLALLLDGDQSFARRRLRNALSLDDGALGTSFDEALSGSREPTRARDPSAKSEPITYSDLRRKLIEVPPKLIPGATPPGA